MTESEVNNITWRELDLLFQRKDLNEQLAWSRTREIITVIMNVNSKKRFKSKDVIKLDKIDRPVKPVDKERIREKARAWQLKT
jgi:hypothetical protein